MFSRRTLLERTGKIAATLSLTPKIPLAMGAAETPRFFLQVFLKDGADSSYLFDAREALFTEKGKIQNYRSDKTVYPWTDARGGKTLVSALAQKLESERQNFTILNGVHMAQGFDGHPQNIAVMTTGNPSGGKLFVTDFPMADRVPLSFLAQGRFDGSETPSLEQGVSLRPPTAKKLGDRFRGSGTPDPASRAFTFIKERAAKLAASGSGGLASGGANLLRGLDGVPNIATKQAGVRLCSSTDTVPCDPKHLIQANDTSVMSDGLKTAFEYFYQGLAQSALLSVQYDFDTHDTAQARNQEAVFTKVVDDLKALFTMLKLPFDEARGLSFADVTTVLITSEFSRTMRQTNRSIEETGTDHNPFTNTVILAGRGITKGLIVGSTDLDALDGQGEFSGVSPLHRTLDAELVKAIGRPFDHDNLTSVESAATAFDPANYLTCLNIINTLYQLFEVPSELFKAPTRTGPKAKVLREILS